MQKMESVFFEKETFNEVSLKVNLIYTVEKIFKKIGDHIYKNERVFILTIGHLKVRYNFIAPYDLILDTIYINEGQNIKKGELLFVVEDCSNYLDYSKLAFQNRISVLRNMDLI